MEKKWSKIWKEFNKWWNNLSWPSWEKQQRKLRKLILTEFPKVDTRKVWTYLRSECDRWEKEGRFPSWKQQQNIIKKAVKAQKRSV